MDHKKKIVEISGVNKVYGENHVVKNLTLDVCEGEFLTLLGSSGCGKTTTLRMIAGFEEPTSGTICVEGENIDNKEPFERDVNTVFQSYALFPHMNIYDNIAYGLKMKKVPKAQISRRVPEMLDLVQMGGFEKRFPSQLSGGQKQRVAIARALINRPKVLLLDEPLGALDLKLRKQMQIELKRLQRKLNITFIYVTHDQEEALTMSDRIAVMHDGVLEQVGVPREIYDAPATKFVATFIGETNLFEGYVEREDAGLLTIVTENGRIPAKGKGFKKNDIVAVSVRPEKMKYSSEKMTGFEVPAQVKEHIFVGAVEKTIATLPNGNEIKLERLTGDIEVLGDVVYPYWNLDDARILKSPSDTVVKAIDNDDVLENVQRGAV